MKDSTMVENTFLDYKRISEMSMGVKSKPCLLDTKYNGKPRDDISFYGKNGDIEGP